MARMKDDDRGRYLCETCFDTMTDTGIVKDGVEQACCAACAEAARPRQCPAPVLSHERHGVIDPFPLVGNPYISDEDLTAFIRAEVLADSDRWLAEYVCGWDGARSSRDPRPTG